MDECVTVTSFIRHFVPQQTSTSAVPHTFSHLIDHTLVDGMYTHIAPTFSSTLVPFLTSLYNTVHTISTPGISL